MKQWALITISSLMIANAQADNSFCGYKDYFHLSESSNASVSVISGYTDADVILQLVGPRSFVVRDSSNCQTGYAHVTIASDSAHWCILDIQDGPYINHPTVYGSCSGLQYISTEHDGLGSHSYSINVA